MNNNDPMKRFGYIVFSICLFALSACTPHEQMDQAWQPVNPVSARY